MDRRTRQSNMEISDDVTICNNVYVLEPFSKTLDFQYDLHVQCNYLFFASSKVKNDADFKRNMPHSVVLAQKPDKPC